MTFAGVSGGLPAIAASLIALPLGFAAYAVSLVLFAAAAKQRIIGTVVPGTHKQVPYPPPIIKLP